jgi:mRNA-degrading endonuclease RelE of RelBE toxin-antitoxin system
VADASPPRFRVVLDRRAQRELERLPRHVRAAFLEAFPKMEVDPLTPRSGLDVRPLAGLPGVRRLRIGRFRGLYEVQGTEVWFTRFGPRGSVYS